MARRRHWYEKLGLSADPFATPPAEPWWDVERARVLGEVLRDAAGAAPVIAVIAPAGAGKSVVRRAAAAHRAASALCLELDGHVFLERAELVDRLREAFASAREQTAPEKMTLRDLASAMAACIRDGEKLSILVDDADELPDESLDALMSLAASLARRPLRIALFGREPLAERLRDHARAKHVQFETLPPVERDQLAAYLEARLAPFAPESRPPRFADLELDDVARRSAGLPGRIDGYVREILRARAEGGRRDRSRPRRRSRRHGLARWLRRLRRKIGRLVLVGGVAVLALWWLASPSPGPTVRVAGTPATDDAAPPPAPDGGAPIAGREARDAPDPASRLAPPIASSVPDGEVDAVTGAEPGSSVPADDAERTARSAAPVAALSSSPSTASSPVPATTTPPTPPRPEPQSGAEPGPVLAEDGAADRITGEVGDADRPEALARAGDASSAQGEAPVPSGTPGSETETETETETASTTNPGAGREDSDERSALLAGPRIESDDGLAAEPADRGSAPIADAAPKTDTPDGGPDAESPDPRVGRSAAPDRSSPPAVTAEAPAASVAPTTEPAPDGPPPDETAPGLLTQFFSLFGVTTPQAPADRPAEAASDASVSEASDGPEPAVESTTGDAVAVAVGSIGPSPSGSPDATTGEGDAPRGAEPGATPAPGPAVADAVPREAGGFPSIPTVSGAGPAPAAADPERGARASGDAAGPTEVPGSPAPVSDAIADAPAETGAARIAAASPPTDEAPEPANVTPAPQPAGAPTRILDLSLPSGLRSSEGAPLGAGGSLRSALADPVDATARALGPGYTRTTGRAAAPVAGEREILAMRGDDLVLQLMVLSSQTRVAVWLAEQRGLGDFAIYQRGRAGEGPWVILQGPFRDRAAATSAARAIETRAGVLNPWVRRVAEVHDEILGP